MAVVLHCLSTRVSGLTSAEAAKRLLKNGPNVVTPPPRRPLLLKLFLQFFQGFAVVLWVTAILCYLGVCSPFAPSLTPLCFAAYNPFGSYQGGTPYVGNLYLAIIVLFVIAFRSEFRSF